VYRFLGHSVNAEENERYPEKYGGKGNILEDSWGDTYKPGKRVFRTYSKGSKRIECCQNPKSKIRQKV
jgi:hypothetical protein